MVQRWPRESDLITAYALAELLKRRLVVTDGSLRGALLRAFGSPGFALMVGDKASGCRFRLAGVLSNAA